MAEREAQYIHLRLIYVVVQQESTQRCETIILQLGKEVLNILLLIPRTIAAGEEER